MLAKTTSLEAATHCSSRVSSAHSKILWAMRSTASMLTPARRDATFTEEHTRWVVASASGMEWMSRRSPSPMPFCTMAEKPPR